MFCVAALSSISLMVVIFSPVSSKSISHMYSLLQSPTPFAVAVKVECATARRLERSAK